MVDDEHSGTDAPDATRWLWSSPLPPSPSKRLSAARDAEFSEFYRAEVSRVMGFVMKIGATEHEAAEATQAAFTHALANWRSIHSNRRAWVRTVAIRQFYRQIPVREFPSATVPEPPTMLSPETIVETSERTKTAHELLAGLPPTQRHTMAWTADGFSAAEIAGFTGKTEAAVRKNLQRARDTLKRRLRETDGGAE